MAGHKTVNEGGPNANTKTNVDTNNTNISMCSLPDHISETMKDDDKHSTTSTTPSSPTSSVPASPTRANGANANAIASNSNSDACPCTATSSNSPKCLQEELNSKMMEISRHLPEEMKRLYMQKLKEYAESPIFQHALKVGDTFPDFSLPDDNCDEPPSCLSSVDVAANYDYILVTFFRGGWCGFCHTSLEILNEYVDQFRTQVNTAVIAISPQTCQQNLLLKMSKKLQFPILQDEHCEFAQTCSIAYELDEALRPFADKIPEYNGNDDWVIPIPATYLVRTVDSKILYTFYEVDPSKRAEPMDLIRILEEDLKKQLEEQELELQKLSMQEMKGKKADVTIQQQEAPQLPPPIPKKAPISLASPSKSIGLTSTTPLNDALLSIVERMEEEDMEREAAVAAAEAVVAAEAESGSSDGSRSSSPTNTGDVAKKPSLESKRSSRVTFGRSSMRTMFREIRYLKEAGIDKAALKVGQIAPEFQLADIRNPKKIYDSKKLLKKHGPMVVIFVHGDWSRFCQVTLLAWQDIYAKIKVKGAQLVAITPSKVNESQLRQQTWLSDLEFPVLLDENNTVAKHFRLRYQMDAKLLGQRQDWPLPMTATYILSDNKGSKKSSKAAAFGEILFAHVDCDHTKRAEPTKVLELIPARKSCCQRKRGPFSLRLSGWLPLVGGKSSSSRNSSTTAISSRSSVASTTSNGSSNA